MGGKLAASGDTWSGSDFVVVATYPTAETERAARAALVAIHLLRAQVPSAAL